MANAEALHRGLRLLELMAVLLPPARAREEARAADRADALAGGDRGEPAAAIPARLVHSDGCRFENTGRRGWRAPRYSFYNHSEAIRLLFVWACELLGLHLTASGRAVYVSRLAEVSVLDEFIGPKR